MNDYPSPTSHRTLRALLRTVERAYDREDGEALSDVYDIADGLTEDYGDLIEYINGLSERLRDGEYNSYFMYTDGDLVDMKAELEKEAYGDFDEAMKSMEYDLNSIDRYRSEDSMESHVFRPELFADDDREVWNKLWRAATFYFNDPKNDAAYRMIGDALMKIRSYQQKSHGPLVPTLTATYRTKNEGVSVRLAWFDECLHVMTHAPFADELDEYFINTSPINGIVDFTPECFPESIGEYRLGSINRSNLFRYEL